MTAGAGPEPGATTAASAARPALPLLIVENSPVHRRFLRGALEATPEFAVVGEARNGREAVAMAERLGPAAILMDLDLPLMSGLEAIERIMASRPTPIVVYAAFAGDEEHAANAMEALAAGAVDVVAKPDWAERGDLVEYADDLRRRLRVAARVKVITHPRGRLRAGLRPRPVAAAAPAGSTAPSTASAGTPGDAARSSGVAMATGRPPVPAFAGPPRPAREPLRRVPDCELVAIGASTGGPQALATLLGSLPAEFAPAVLVVQHMADGFIPGLVAWLDELCRLPVVQGQSGRRLQPGTVTVAPSGLNLLVLDRLRVVCEDAPARQFHVPGIDASFHSIADSLGAGAIGVLLTGMGRDGAAGLRAMRERGAVTIGQDESTSVVYGMPAAAHAIGALDFQLPLPEITPTILELLRAEEGRCGSP